MCVCVCVQLNVLQMKWASDATSTAHNQPQFLSGRCSARSHTHTNRHAHTNVKAEFVHFQNGGHDVVAFAPDIFTILFFRTNYLVCVCVVPCGFHTDDAGSQNCEMSIERFLFQISNPWSFYVSVYWERHTLLWHPSFPPPTSPSTIFTLFERAGEQNVIITLVE